MRPQQAAWSPVVPRARYPSRHDERCAVASLRERRRRRVQKLAGLETIEHRRLRDGRLKPIVGAIRRLAEAPAAFVPDRRTPGKTIIQIADG
jgi:hypothetical protein